MQATGLIIFKDFSERWVVKKNKQINKTMEAAEKSLLNASDLCSIEISKIKDIHPWGNISKNVHPIWLLKKLWVLKQLKNLSVYHFLTTQFSDILKIC